MKQIIIYREGCLLTMQEPEKLWNPKFKWPVAYLEKDNVFEDIRLRWNSSMHASMNTDWEQLLLFLGDHRLDSGKMVPSGHRWHHNGNNSCEQPYQWIVESSDHFHPDRVPEEHNHIPLVNEPSRFWHGAGNRCNEKLFFFVFVTTLYKTFAIPLAKPKHDQSINKL